MRENVRPGGHRPNRSRDEEAMRARKAKQNLELDIFADPNDSPKRRARRNSDTSIVGGKLLDPEDERRRLEREKRHRRREKDSSKKPKNPLDIIDQLDATSIFGTGGEFLFILEYDVNTDHTQHSITTDHSMHATLAVTGREVDVRQCKHSPRIR
jgi:hypothetical protein